MTIHLCHEGRKLGAFSHEQVQAMLKGGVITHDTLAWIAGFDDWKRLGEVLAPPAPPPLPHSLLHYTPIEDTSTANVPPIIPSPPENDFSGNYEAIELERRKLRDDAKLGVWCILAWIVAIIFVGVFTGLSGKDLPGRATTLRDGDTIQPDPKVVVHLALAQSGGFALLSLIIGLRGLARKSTAAVLIKRQWTFHNYGRDVYLPAILGTLWRSAIPIFCSGGFFAFAMDDPVAKVQALVTTIVLWTLAFPFALDRPIWFKSRVRRLAGSIDIPSASTHHEMRQASGVARRCSNPIVLVGSLITALVLLIGWFYWWARPEVNNSALREPELKRLGELFPSITRHGNPQQVVKWKSVDSTATYESPIHFIDRAKTAFLAPPSDILVPVYPPGVGAVEQAQSPTARIGRERDSVLHITDTRPGACVVWVGRTNADDASYDLCAHYAVLAACGIADQNDQKYKYLEICEGGGWRKDAPNGGSLVYLPVLFYARKPTTDSSSVQSVEEIRDRATKGLEAVFSFFDAVAAEKAKSSSK